MRHVIFALLLVAACAAHARTPPLLPEKDVAALANELSGEAAKRNLEGIARYHRQRGSQGFHAAAELIAASARAYGLSNVEILKFPADGRIFYGPQRSRQAWDAEEGELAEVRDGREIKLASYAAEPVVLAEDSDVVATRKAVEVGKLLRTAAALERDATGQQEYDRRVATSIEAFATNTPPKSGNTKAQSDGTPVFHRRAEPRGPLAVSGYDYFEDHAHAAGVPTPKLLNDRLGAEYSYEALNFADGKHSARQIAAELSAEYGPVPTELVIEYLQALKRIGVVD